MPSKGCAKAEARRLAELKIAEQKAAEAETAARAAAEKAQRLAALEQKQKAEAAARQKRAKPPVKFASWIGKLAYPAQGELVRNFNDKDGYGGRSEGLHIATGKLAQITTPADGDVEFAGEFRSYGKLIIINTGDGYHVLLAGLPQDHCICRTGPWRQANLSEPWASILLAEL